MLSALTLALQQSEAQLARFLEKVSTRTNIPKDELLQMWESSSQEPGLASQEAVVEQPEVTQLVQPPIPEQAKPVEKIVEQAPPQVIQPPPIVPLEQAPPQVEKSKKVIIEDEEDIPVPPPVVTKSNKVIIEEDEDDVKQSPPPPPPQQSSRCRHIMVSGKSKGQPCGAPARENGFCTKHKSSAPPEPAPKPAQEQVPKPVEQKPVPKPAQEPIPVIEKVDPPVQEKPTIEKKVKTPPKVPQVEHVKLTTLEEEKRIDFRVKVRDFILDNKKYPEAPVKTYKDFLLVEGTRVVLNSDKSAVLGYLDTKDNLVRVPTKDTDKVVLEYGIIFDASHISDSDIDD